MNQQQSDSNNELAHPKANKMVKVAIIIAAVALGLIGILNSWGCSNDTPLGNKGDNKKVTTAETEVSRECCPAKKPLTLETLEADLKEINEAITTLQTEDGKINKKVDEVVGNVTTLTKTVNELADKVKDLDINKADKTELGKFASRRRVSRLEVNLNAHITSDQTKPAPEPAATIPPPPVEAPTRPPGTVTIRAVRVPRR